MPVAMVILATAASLLLAPSAAMAGPVPSPLPWMRTYVAELPFDPIQAQLNLYPMCARDRERGVWDNGATSKPRIGVVGDSVQAQTRDAEMADSAYHWIDLTHCGENVGTALTSGRVADVLAQNPEVLVAGFGTNNFSEAWFVTPALFPVYQANLETLLDQSDHVRCRVLFNFSDETAAFHPENERTTWASLTLAANLHLARIDPVAHPNVIIADWQAATAADPDLVFDDQHLSNKGINARMNLALASSRKCFVPDHPSNVKAKSSSGSATVWWDPLPPEEAVTSYTVTSSLGHTIATTAPTVNVAGLTNGTPVSFTVRANNARGTSTVSLPSNTVTPSSMGTRFHATTPVRVLDTRSGLGGRWVPLGPTGEMSFNAFAGLPAAAQAASAVVLNVTATGQTAPSFVTVWPDGESRPLASNVNVRPGIAAIAASVTTAAGSNGRVRLFNNSGSVHLVVDVVGWFTAPAADPAAADASLFHSVDPVRVLDSRTTLGGHAGVFGSADDHDVVLPDLPAGATAAVVTVTSTNTVAPGFVTLSPAGAPRPLSSNLNPQPGLTRANLTTVKLSAGGAFTIYNQSANTHLIVDLVGWYGPTSIGGGAEYFSLTPERSYDTRNGTGGIIGPARNTSPSRLSFSGKGSVPIGAAVVAVDTNVTVVQPSSGGHATIWPTGAPKPDTSMVNYATDEVVAGRVITKLGSGAAEVWASASSIHYVVDVSGWFAMAEL